MRNYKALLKESFSLLWDVKSISRESFSLLWLAELYSTLVETSFQEISLKSFLKILIWISQTYGKVHWSNIGSSFFRCPLHSLSKSHSLLPETVQLTYNANIMCCILCLILNWCRGSGSRQTSGSLSHRGHEKLCGVELESSRRQGPWRGYVLRGEGQRAKLNLTS